MKTFKQDEKKLAELILYVCQKCADDPCFGSTKLNKILYYADFYHYGNYGKPITGVEYQKLPHGPAPRRLLPVTQKLESECAFGIQPAPLRSGAVQKRPVNLREPDLSIFAGDEIATVDSIIEALHDLDTGAVSELSHQEVGYQTVEQGETIPYSTILLSSAPLSAAELRRGLEIAAKHGL